MTPEPTATLTDRARAFGEQWTERRCSLIAAGIAFYAILALVPALGAFAGIYTLLVDDTPVRPFEEPVVEVLPPQMQDVIVEHLETLRETSASTITVGAILAVVTSLWSASAAVKHLLDALTPAGQRSTYVRSRLLGVGLTGGLLVFLALALAAVAALPRLVERGGVDTDQLSWLVFLRWPLTAVGMMLVAATLYRVADRGSARPRFFTRGAVLAAGLWLVGSVAFSTVSAHAPNLERSYGSFATAAVSLLWFWLFAAALLIGEITDEVRGARPFGPSPDPGHAGP